MATHHTDASATGVDRLERHRFFFLFNVPFAPLLKVTNQSITNKEISKKSRTLFLLPHTYCSLPERKLVVIKINFVHHRFYLLLIHSN